MKNLKATLVTAMVSAALFLTGCGAPPEETQATLPPLPTESSVTETTEPLDLGSMSFGFGDNTPKYLSCEGGEIRVGAYLCADGQCLRNRQGILLFLDGQPQMYHTDEDPTDRYMHIFGGGTQQEFTPELIFDPVTGKAGETLEIKIMNINYPEFEIKKSGSVTPFLFTDSTFSFCKAVEFHADPEPQEPAALPEGLSGVQVTQREATLQDVSVFTRGWAEDMMESGVGARCFLSGKPDHADRYIYGVTKDSEIEFRYEVYGCPGAELGLCLFVENQPVAIDGSPFLPLTLSRGMKTVVEGTLRVPDFDGEAAVYAVLVPRNAAQQELRDVAAAPSTGAFILLDIADLDELMETDPQE